MASLERNDSANPSRPPRILSISDDELLRYSRELLLLNEGYDTESVTSDTVLSAARVQSFDAVLICRSVDPRRAAALNELLHRYHPEVKIMYVASLDGIEPHDIDLEIASDPELLLEALRHLCHRNRRTPVRKSMQTPDGA